MKRYKATFTPLQVTSIIPTRKHDLTDGIVTDSGDTEEYAVFDADTDAEAFEKAKDIFMRHYGRSLN